MACWCVSDYAIDGSLQLQLPPALSLSLASVRGVLLLSRVLVAVAHTRVVAVCRLARATASRPSSRTAQQTRTLLAPPCTSLTCRFG